MGHSEGCFPGSVSCGPAASRCRARAGLRCQGESREAKASGPDSRDGTGREGPAWVAAEAGGRPRQGARGASWGSGRPGPPSPLAHYQPDPTAPPHQATGNAICPRLELPRTNATLPQPARTGRVSPAVSCVPTWLSMELRLPTAPQPGLSGPAPGPGKFQKSRALEPRRGNDRRHSPRSSPVSCFLWVRTAGCQSRTQPRLRGSREHVGRVGGEEWEGPPAFPTWRL